MSDCALAIKSAKEWGVRMPRLWIAQFGGCLHHNAASAAEYTEYRHQRQIVKSLVRPFNKEFTDDN
ncbi:TPA: hypothetical protein QIY66_000643 [Raoultella planticola]|uniref:hypothetical protein n=1 Tax=Raoultella ornithinolytica TaxID=54291 RepID=UPI0012DAA84C|nr:hypothetical protein [Raoultella ornithinolytica]HDV8886616.1 hypothetical protein [Raoultella planticola]